MKDLEQYYPLVKRIALKWYNKSLNKTSAEFEDFFHEGLIGLIQAYNKFDESKGIEFWAFASQRVEGAILDFLRKSPVLKVPQEKRERQKQWNAAYELLSHKLSKEPNDAEVARYLGISDAEIRDIKESVFIIEDIENAGESDESPFDDYIRKKIAEDIDECLKNLSDEERLIFISRKKDDVSLKDLANLFATYIEKVRRQEKSATGKMKKCLEGMGWSEEDV